MSYTGSIIVHRFEATQRKPRPTEGWLEVDPPYAFLGEAVLAPGVVVPRSWLDHRSAFRVHQVTTPRPDGHGFLQVTFRGEVDAQAARALEGHSEERDWIEREVVADIVWRLQLMPGPHHKAAPLPPRKPRLTGPERALLEKLVAFTPTGSAKRNDGQLTRVLEELTAPTPDYEQADIPILPKTSQVQPSPPLPPLINPDLVPEHLKVYLEPLKKKKEEEESACIPAPTDLVVQLVKDGLVSVETLVGLIGTEALVRSGIAPAGPPPPAAGTARRRRTVDI